MGRYDLYLVVYTIHHTLESKTTKATLFANDQLAWEFTNGMMDDMDGRFEIHWEGWVDG